MNNIKFKRCLWLVIIFLLCQSGYAQQAITVRAKVVDSSDNRPLIGATVSVRGTSQGVITDLDGFFQLKVLPHHKLVISYVGYRKLIIDAKEAKKAGTIVLSSDSEELDEIIVVGYGVQKKASTVASISTTKGDDLLQGGSLNSVSEALQGKLNGVVAINSSGMPGENSASIFIRGKASWNGTSPLVLVDGIERNMNDVDFNEIESISVLKDASATAVYGVRGANGVILLTTKRGSKQKAKITFTANLGFKQMTTKLDWADYITSMKTYNEALANDNNWDKQIPTSTIQAWEQAYATGNYGPYNDAFPEVDWFDEITKDFGFSQNYNVNVQGGMEKMDYFISLGYQYDGGNYNIDKQADFDPRYYYRRYNWRANFDFKLTNTTTFSANVAGNMGYRNKPSGGTNFAKTFQAPNNTFPIKYSDGYWGDISESGYNLIANMNTKGQNMLKRFQGWYDFILKQDLSFVTKGLSVKARVSYNQFMSTESKIIVGLVQGINGAFAEKNSSIRYYREYDYANPIYNEDGSISYPLKQNKRFPSEYQDDERYPVNSNYDALNDVGRRLYYEFALEYNRQFGAHKISALALMNRQIIENKGKENVMQFPSYTEDWVGRVTYNWKERYLGEVNMAYTGSEKFAPGHRFGFFPSFSLGWRISEEPFIKKKFGSVLTNMKVRYSYGQVGSDAGAPRFNYIQIYNQANNVQFGDSQNVGFGPTFKEGTMADPLSTWEVATKQNLGLELSLWNKLSMSIDLFNERRTGILMAPRTTLAWYGIGLPSLNMGETKNHGFELDLGWHDKIGKNWRYSMNYSLSMNENRIVFRDDPSDLESHLKEAGKPIDWQARFLAVGNYETIDDVFNHAQTAIGQASPQKVIPGDLVYIDYNGDGILNINDKAAVSQMNYPQTTMSLNLGLEYKGWGLNAMIYAPLGVYKLQFDQYLWDFPESNIKAQPDVLNHWTPEKANTNKVMRPALHLDRGHNSVQSTYSYANHSYVRLKHLELSYKFPKKLLKPLSITACQFYIKGNNLLTFSNVDNRVDPETGGADTYPIVRTYTVGTRITF